VKEGFKDTKGVIRICNSKKNRQRNDQKKKTLKTGGVELMCYGRISSSSVTSVTHDRIRL